MNAHQLDLNKKTKDMAINPKLEFYRFELNHKKDETKTFRDFAIDELSSGKKSSEENVCKVLFRHFIKSLDGNFSKDERLKKEITLIKKNVNKHLDKRPVSKSDSNIISGVLNGGPFGRDGILSDQSNPEDPKTLKRNNTVLRYFYFLIYLPNDHNEGCFIIHSNGVDDSITRIFRGFISNIFRGKNYNKLKCEPFCPKSFQEEFKSGATLKSMIFKETNISDSPSTDSITNLINGYDIKIIATPKNKNISMLKALEIKEYFAKKLFGNERNQKTLDSFNETKIETKNSVSDSKKIFEWNTKDNDFNPVVYLKNRISTFNLDETPDFNELSTFCFNIFNDEIHPELRPDLYVTKA